MCDTCGCAVTAESEESFHNHGHENNKSRQVIELRRDVLHGNNVEALHNREHLNKLKIKSFNLMSSPGSGKTTLLERTISHLDEGTIAVIEGDLETENDARRIREKGAMAYQITTGTACHLDAFMVHRALHHLDLSKIKYLFVENVGNLVCPAAFDLGTEKNIVLLSATEGDDKPEKYPVMFHKADLVLITKTEVAQIMNFDVKKAKEHIFKINPDIPVILLSLSGSDEFDQWIEYLKNA